MDRSFVVEAQMKEGPDMKDVVAVVFLNSGLEKPLLGDLGLAGVKSIEEVRPASKQPSEPTMYVFGHRPGSIKVVRFGWDGKIVNEASVPGEPHALIPPVSGPAAERLIYLPMAHLIMASVKDGPAPKPVIGVLISKPVPGKATLRPDKKTLDRAGFVSIRSVDKVSCLGTAASDSLYLFERVPQPSSVKVFELSPDGSVRGARTLQGEPREIIPKLAGPVADRFIYSGNGGLTKSDFPKRASAPPPSSEPPAKKRY